MAFDGILVPDFPRLDVIGPRYVIRQYYDLDDILGEAELRRTPDLTKYQFDGHGLRRVHVLLRMEISQQRKKFSECWDLNVPQREQKGSRNKT